jgi:sugar phosphate isomerase/epimerase
MENELWDLFEAEQAQTPKYDEVKERLVAARAAQAEANLDAVRRSLVELAAYAGRAGIHLGLENRYHYLDIPLLDEMGALLEPMDAERVGFWYDVGHAQTLDNLGFDSHEEWLRRYAPRMTGVHFHDVKGIRDHHAAGLGEVDWDMVSAYIPANVIRTCEFQDHNTPGQVAEAIQFLADKGCVKRF